MFLLQKMVVNKKNFENLINSVLTFECFVFLWHFGLERIKCHYFQKLCGAYLLYIFNTLFHLSMLNIEQNFGSILEELEKLFMSLDLSFFLYSSQVSVLLSGKAMVLGSFPFNGNE